MIRKYYATKDNTITNAFELNLTTRGTGSNMGASDILETFTIYGQVSNSSGLSSEKSRIIIEFPIGQLTNERAAGTLPASGSVDFYLNLYNAKHSQTLPRKFWLSILPIRDEWQEGFGLDMETYTDLTYDQTGSNWIMTEGATTWGDTDGSTQEGGYYWNDKSSSFSQYFEEGTEDLQVNITTLVEQWINSQGNTLGSKDNYGVGIHFSGSFEDSPRSYYTKKFFSRTTNWFFERPTIEARWDSSIQDDRGQCYRSSSLAPAADNLNSIYLYNYVRGKLANIPTVEATDGEICVSIFSGTILNNGPGGNALNLVPDYAGNVRPANTMVITGSKVSTGIYKATFAYTGSSDLDTIYDVWFSGSDHHTSAEFQAVQYKTGTINVKSFEADSYSDSKKYYLSVTNRTSDYYYDQTYRIRLYARERDWSPNIYSVATNVPPSLTFESASYQIRRMTDNKVVIPYDTGSNLATRLSFDVSGNYFDLNASLLEPNYAYGVQFSIYDSDTSTYEEQPYTYKLRVVKNEY
tara:strand:- start:35 stop:1600 length:1566 start_codon:yes stop_codon:yes gene_type:complete